MNAREVAISLATFCAAWPNTKLTEETTLLWVEALADIDPAGAKLATAQIVREDQWFPTIARFREVAKARAPRDIPNALPEAPPNFPRNVELVRATRKALADHKRGEPVRLGDLLNRDDVA